MNENATLNVDESLIMGQSLSFVLDDMKEKMESTGFGIPGKMIDETISSIDSNSPGAAHGRPYQSGMLQNQRNVTSVRTEDIEMSLVPPMVHHTAAGSSMCMSVAEKGTTGHQAQATCGSDMDISCSPIDAPQKTLAMDGRKSADMDITKPIKTKAAQPSLARSLLERSVLKERSNMMQPHSAIPISERTVCQKLDMEYSKIDSFLMNERECQSIEVPVKSETMIGDKTIDETLKDKAIGELNSN